jgi:hypothetical protein
MALATQPLTFAYVQIVTSATAELPTVAIPDNCVEITLYNVGPGAALYGIAAAGAGTLTDGVNSMVLPAGATRTIAIGPLPQRTLMNDADNPGCGIVYSGFNGSLPLIYIEYRNLLGQIK